MAEINESVTLLSNNVDRVLVKVRRANQGELTIPQALQMVTELRRLLCELWSNSPQQKYWEQLYPATVNGTPHIARQALDRMRRATQGGYLQAHPFLNKLTGEIVWCLVSAEGLSRAALQPIAQVLEDTACLIGEQEASAQAPDAAAVVAAHNATLYQDVREDDEEEEEEDDNYEEDENYEDEESEDENTDGDEGQG